VPLVVALLGRAPRWSTAEVRQLVRDVAFDSLEAPLRQDAALPLKLPVALRRNEFLRAGEKLLDGQRIVVLHYRVPGTLDTCEVYVIPSAMLSESVPVFSNMLLTTDAGRTLAIWRENDHVFAFVYNGAGGEDVLQRLRPSPELT
jgi:hypothetical protein